MHPRFFHACSRLLVATSLAVLAVDECCPAQSHGSNRWTSSLQLSADGWYPALAYSSTDPGDLRVFYVVPGSSAEKMVVRARLDGWAWAPESSITDASGTIDFGTGVRNVSVHHGPGTIDLALSKSSIATILQSTDDGASWVFKKSFSNTGDATASYLPVHFTDDAPDRLRLVYGYIKTLIVATKFIYSAKRECPGQTGNWCASTQVFYDDGGSPYPAMGAIQKVYEDGPDITMACGGSVYHSGDDGTTYDVIKDPGDSTENLAGADMALGAGSRLWLIQPYTFGPPPDNNHLKAYVSDDFGATWGPPVRIITSSSSPIASPRVAVDGSTIVMAWKHADASTSYEHRIMKSLVSLDSGTNWVPVDTGISLGGNLEIANLVLANHEGRFSLVYSVTDGSTPAGVHITELLLP